MNCLPFQHRTLKKKLLDQNSYIRWGVVKLAVLFAGVALLCYILCNFTPNGPPPLSSYLFSLALINHHTPPSLIPHPPVATNIATHYHRVLLLEKSHLVRMLQQFPPFLKRVYVAGKSLLFYFVKLDV